MRFTRMSLIVAVCLGLLASFTLADVAEAKTAQEIDASVNAALDRFYGQVRGARDIVQRAQGVLVLARVLKAGIGVGGEYGEGALRISGNTAAYYSIASASIGFQLGAQQKDIILVFLQSDALARFRANNAWQIGLNGSVAIVNVGADGSIDSRTLNKPVVAFVVGQRGLMYNLTLEGSKVTKLDK